MFFSPIDTPSPFKKEKRKRNPPKSVCSNVDNYGEPLTYK